MALANECVPYKLPAISVSAKATAAIAGKRFIKISGNRTGGGGEGAAGATTVGVGLSTDLENLYQVAQCVAKDNCFGVSGYDTPINGEVKVYKKAAGIIVPVTAGAAIVAGVEVESDAEGKAITLAAGRALGMCLNAVSGANKDAEILLY